MRFNNKELIHVSHSNPILEGRMSYAKLSNGYPPSKGNNNKKEKNLIIYNYLLHRYVMTIRYTDNDLPNINYV